MKKTESKFRLHPSVYFGIDSPEIREIHESLMPSCEDLLYRISLKGGKKYGKLGRKFTYNTLSMNVTKPIFTKTLTFTTSFFKEIPYQIS
jgi:hypothetical protein